MSLVADRGGHLKVFVFCELIHIFLFSGLEFLYIFLFVSVSLLLKEHSSVRVCSRSNIAGDDLTFGIKSFIGAIPEHSLCEVRTHLLQHGRYGQDRTNIIFRHDLRNDSSMFGQQLVVLCSPLMTWLNEL